MPAKQLAYDEQARRSLKKGMDILAEAVKTTLGPKGRNVALDKKWGAPTVTHDGVTVAKEIELKDPYENMGAQLLKEAATKTNDVAGDGTTTATVLAQAIINEGMKNVAAGANPMMLKRGIEKAAEEEIVAEIKAMATPVKGKEEISDIATISAADPEIGDLIAEVMDKVGKDGVITVEEGRGPALRDRVHRGHAVRPGLHLPLLHHEPRPDGDRPGGALHPDHRQEDLRHRRHPARPGEGAAGEQEAADPGRGRGGRGAGDPGGEQAAGHHQRAGGQGPWLWGPAQGDARGHRDPDRRQGDLRGGRVASWTPRR